MQNPNNNNILLLRGGGRRRSGRVAPPGPANPGVRVDPDNGRHVLRRGDTTQRVEDSPKHHRGEENRVRRVARSAGGGESDENIPELRIPDDERVRETEGVFLRRKDECFPKRVRRATCHSNKCSRIRPCWSESLKDLNMIVPNMLTMAWVNFFFTGFVVGRYRFRSHNGFDRCYNAESI